MKKISKKLIILLLLLITTGCSSSIDKKEKIILGGGHFSEPVLTMIEEGLKNKGYDVEVMLFDGNQLPATACMEGEIDGLVFNHKPWIDKFNKEHNSNLITMEPYLYYSRTALYSLKHNSIDSIPENATIAIPGDPTNLELSLLLLEKNKLIELGKKNSEFYSLIDIEKNKKNLDFIETEITQTIASIEDVDAVVVNAKNAVDYGLDADDFLVENELKKDFPVGLVVEKGSEKKQWVKDALEITQTEEFRERFNEEYQGTVVMYD